MARRKIEQFDEAIVDEVNAAWDEAQGQMDDQKLSESVRKTGRRDHRPHQRKIILLPGSARQALRA